MRERKGKFGFTIVELLTVMSVIAILIGLLVPALNLVRRMAVDTKQKAQFHSISVSLDIFNGDMDGYPDSTELGYSGKYTVGAQRLAEALMGRDFQGFDPMSSWNAGQDAATSGAYDPATSLDRRKGPYLNPEHIEAYSLLQIYGSTGINNNGSLVYDGNDGLVLTDAYRVKRITVGGKTVKAGSPILYFKANTSLRDFPLQSKTSISDADAMSYIYNVMDNEPLLALGTLLDAKAHYQNTSNAYDRTVFYNSIRNPKITNMPRPYNQTSYILISAGYDGQFGTSDDIYNFTE